MSETVNEASIDLTNPTVVETVMGDAELRKLPVGSDEFKAAATLKLAKKPEESAPEASTEVAQVEEGSEDNTEQPEQEGQPPKKKRGVEKRIDELVREREELRRQVEALSRQQPQQRQEEAPREEASDFDKPKPQLADFDSLQDYTEALTDWKIEKREFEHYQRAQQEQLQHSVKETADTWETREKSVKKELTDYEHVVNVDSLQKANVTQPAAEALAKSELGPKVLYTLLDSDELAEKFASASPTEQVKLIGKIEAKLELSETAEETPRETTVTKAPTPAKPLPKGKAVATVKNVYDTSISMTDFFKLRAEQEKARKRM